MPDPIMEPTMKATPDQRPTFRFNATSFSAESVVDDEPDEALRGPEGL